MEAGKSKAEFPVGRTHSALEVQAVEHDLEVARQIQRSLLPKSFPELPGFEAGGFCQSARQVGGDFYDVIPLRGGATLFVISDAMGKGVPAAMLTATFRALLRSLIHLTSSPGDLLARINRLMFDELSGVDMFITVQLAALEPRERRLTVASVGHCPLLLWNNDSGTDLISPEGVPLGIMPEAVFVETVVLLQPGAALLLYTDGVTDVRNREGHFFTQQRLEDWLYRNMRAKLTALQLKEKLLQELAVFQSSAAAGDDQTFIILVSSKDDSGTQEQPAPSKASILLLPRSDILELPLPARLLGAPGPTAPPGGQSPVPSLTVAKQETVPAALKSIPPTADLRVVSPSD
jgi:serine phosphatase RsbU (regulator of sigma subunit)